MASRAGCRRGRCGAVAGSTQIESLLSRFRLASPHPGTGRLLAFEGAGNRRPAFSQVPVAFRYLKFVAMSDSLSLSRQFSLESQSRAIENCGDIEELRRVAQTLLKAWHLQSEFSQRYGAQALGIVPA